MSRYLIDQDQARCIGCRACEIHCKTEHDVPVGPKFCEIVETGLEEVNGVPRVRFIFMPCFHCEQAACITACPTGAMRRRESDGLVFTEESRCVGCKACLIACPWGVPQWNVAKGKVFKCDYCKERLDEGLLPACVSGCTTRSLRFVTPEEATRRKRRQTALDFGSSAMPGKERSDRP